MVNTVPERFPDGIDPEPALPYGRRPLCEYLDRHADERPTKPAIEYYGRTITYGELDATVDAFAAALADRGYGPGDSLIVYLHNVPQFTVALLGAHRIGVVPAAPMPDGDEARLHHYVDNADARGIVVHDTYAPMVDRVRDDTALRDVLYVRYGTYLPGDPVPAVSDRVREAVGADRRATADGTRYLDDVLSAAPSEPPPVDVSLDDRSLFMYTGGTTGTPKTAVFTHGSNLHGSASVAAAWEFDEHDVNLLAYHVQRSPLFFSVLPHLVYGNTNVLLEQTPGTERVMAAIDRYDVEIAMVRSPLLKAILDHPDRDEHDFTSVGRLACLSFQTEFTEDMAERWRDLSGAPAYEYAWGSVELHGVATFGNRIDVYEPGFVGLPIHGADVVVRDVDTGEPVPAGEVGEITVDYPAMFEGYHRLPDRTAEAIRDGYFYTDDVGRITDEGYLYFLGRRRELVEIAGEHVAPREIERIVEAHPAVEGAGVVARERDGGTDAELVCVVTLDDEAAEAEILAWIDRRTDAAFKRPAAVVVVDELPVSNVGKLDRDALEERVG